MNNIYYLATLVFPLLLYPSAPNEGPAIVDKNKVEVIVSHEINIENLTSKIRENREIIWKRESAISKAELELEEIRVSQFEIHEKREALKTAMQSHNFGAIKTKIRLFERFNRKLNESNEQLERSIIRKKMNKLENKDEINQLNIEVQENEKTIQESLDQIEQLNTLIETYQLEAMDLQRRSLMRDQELLRKKVVRIQGVILRNRSIIENLQAANADIENQIAKIREIPRDDFTAKELACPEF